MGTVSYHPNYFKIQTICSKVHAHRTEPTHLFLGQEPATPQRLLAGGHIGLERKPISGGDERLKDPGL